MFISLHLFQPGFLTWPTDWSPSVHFSTVASDLFKVQTSSLSTSSCISWPQWKPFNAHHCTEANIHTLTYGLQDLSLSNPCILLLTFTNVVSSTQNTSQSPTSIFHYHHLVTIALQRDSLKNMTCQSYEFTPVLSVKQKRMISGFENAFCCNHMSVQYQGKINPY